MHIGEKLVMRNNKSGKRHIDCVNRKFHFAFISIFVLVIILLTFCTKTAFTNEMVDNSKIEYIESRLYIIYESAMNFASEIIAKNKPIFLTKFTDDERYISEDTAEFFDTQPGYSEAIWRGIWLKNGTIITGWAKEDKIFYADSFETKDVELTFPGDIRIWGNTNLLENFFGGRLDEISIVEKGFVESIALLGTDTLGPFVSIEYNSDGKIIHISANNGYTDKIPSGFIPASQKADDFHKKLLKQLKYHGLIDPKCIFIVAFAYLIFLVSFYTIKHKFFHNNSSNADYPVLFAHLATIKGRLSWSSALWVLISIFPSPIRFFTWLFWGKTSYLLYEEALYKVGTKIAMFTALTFITLTLFYYVIRKPLQESTKLFRITYFIIACWIIFIVLVLIFTDGHIFDKYKRDDVIMFNAVIAALLPSVLLSFAVLIYQNYIK